MSAKIYCFSGTGNSLKIARDIAAGLDAEVVLIPKLQQNERIRLDAELVGIVFPVYVWGLPRIVSDFIKGLESGEEKHVFAAATCGSSVGRSLKQSEKLLAHSGIRLSAAYKIAMPGNYIVMYGAFSEKRQQKCFDKAREKTAQIIEDVQNKKGKRIPGGFFPLNFLTRAFYNFSMPHLPQADARFFADETCDACRICEKICPAGNISMQDDKPVWHGNCEQCMACLQWCPQEAIQYGKGTAKRKRYHHPGVTVKDLM